MNRGKVPLLGDERLPHRFWAKIAVRADGCWHWTAGKKATGYGQYGDGGTMRIAHRIAFERLVGPIPSGLDLDHLCRNRSCVNPSHLEPVTHRENMLRSDTIFAVNARKTRCPRDHAYTPENTYLQGRKRSCLMCRRERDRARTRTTESRRAAA